MKVTGRDIQVMRGTRALLQLPERGSEEERLPLRAVIKDLNGDMKVRLGVLLVSRGKGIAAISSDEMRRFLVLIGATPKQHRKHLLRAIRAVILMDGSDTIHEEGVVRFEKFRSPLLFLGYAEKCWLTLKRLASKRMESGRYSVTDHQLSAFMESMELFEEEDRSFFLKILCKLAMTELFQSMR